MPLSLVSLLSRRCFVTELAPYVWSRSVFFPKSGDYAPHFPSFVAADKSDALLWASPLKRLSGGETEKERGYAVLRHAFKSHTWKKVMPEGKEHPDGIIFKCCRQNGLYVWLWTSPHLFL